MISDDSLIFTDGNPSGTVSDFVASINWGDGSAPTCGKRHRTIRRAVHSLRRPHVSVNGQLQRLYRTSVHRRGRGECRAAGTGCPVIVGNGAFVIGSTSDSIGSYRLC
jgi:hypothetical protein